MRHPDNEDGHVGAQCLSLGERSALVLVSVVLAIFFLVLVKRQNLEFRCEIDLADFDVIGSAKGDRRKVQDARYPCADETIADLLRHCGRCREHRDIYRPEPRG